MSEWIEPEHKGDFTIQFSDRTGETRTAEEMGAFIRELNCVAINHGFRRSTWGPAETMKKLRGHR
jgi:hypothetical protein